MNSNEALDLAFKNAGEKYGFDSVVAQFEEFQDVKVRWQRSYRWAEFKVTDYLKDAPMEIFTDLADSIFSKIAGKDYGYPQSMKEYLCSKDFRMKQLPLYMERNAHVIKQSDRNLDVLLKDLVERGLLPKDIDATVVWTDDQWYDRLTNSSRIFHVIYVSADAEKMTDEMIAYLIYREAVKFTLPFDPSVDIEDMLNELYAKFPGADVFAQELKVAVEMKRIYADSEDEE